VNPDKMLEQAKAVAEKQGLEGYAATIWELRRKGKTYREIAEFFNKRGVSTDHTAVYRLVRAKGNPLLSLPDGPVLLGEMVYESRQGRPLRSFEAGLDILIKSKLRIIPLKDAAPQPAIWCETHFELNEAPNHDWLKQLSQQLDLRWNPATPYYLQGRFGFELKFEGTLMAMVCQTHNLEHYMNQVGTVVYGTTKFFRQNKVRPYDLKEMFGRRDSEIIDTPVLSQSDSAEEEIEESLKWNQEHARKLTKQFRSTALPHISD